MAAKTQSQGKQVRFGRVTVPYIGQDSEFIPDPEDFADPYGYRERLAFAWEQNWDVALLGPTGVPTTYAGVKAWNPAVLSRFDLVIWMDYLPPDAERALLIKQTSVDDQLARAMVKAANCCRAAVKDSTLRFPFSYRELRNWTS